MEIKPIDIQVDNPRRFSRIAYLVDRDDFLLHIHKFRKQLGIEKPISIDDLNSWRAKEPFKPSKITKNPIRDVSGVPLYYCIQGFPSEEITKFLLQKYHRWSNYFLVIYYALVCGVVPDDSLSIEATCQLIRPDDYYYQVQQGITDPSIAIFVTSRTTKKELLLVYKHVLPGVIEQYKKITKTKDTSFPDTISNIKRDRKWYWLHKNGKTYQQIAYETIGPKLENQNSVKYNERIADYREMIRKAIGQYDKRVNISMKDSYPSEV